MQNKCIFYQFVKGLGSYVKFHTRQELNLDLEQNSGQIEHFPLMNFYIKFQLIKCCGSGSGW